MKPTPYGITALCITVTLSGCWNLTFRDREIDAGSGHIAATDTERDDNDNDSSTEDASEAMTSPCADFRCNTPPADICGEAPTQVVRYAREGYCTVADGTPRCIYATFVDTCLSGNCQDGGCPEAAAQSMYCLSPEPPRCDGDTLIVYTPQGTATAEGGCKYGQQDITCANGCDDGACIGAPCDGVACIAPPARYCFNDILVTWEPNGRCNDNGECRYNRHEVQCKDGCSNGACVEDDVCSRVSCGAPPSSFCLDENTLFAYAKNGSCRDGACIFDGERIACRCIDGKCADDPCLGVTCIFPPSPSCTPDGKLRFWDASWVGDDADELCVNGECVYEFSEGACDQGDCVDGRCSDYCEYRNFYCDLLPASPDYCDGDLAVSYAAHGVCKGAGICEFDTTTKTCDAGCDAGRCL